MKQVLVDANAILRLLLDDIPSQKKTFEQLLQKAKDNKILVFVPQIIIFEIEFILRKYYFVPKDKLVEKLQMVVSMNFIEIESRQSFIMALDFYVKQKMSLVDCFLLARSKIEGYELFTFDKKILRASL